MRPWLNTTHRKLAAKPRQGVNVTVIVAVYRGTVWLSIDSSFLREAILEPAQADSLIELLTQAVTEARSYHRGDGT
ncbi:MAG: hypothetical protein ACRDSP_11515 [Pseudonocardiaceae bacterium]